jgi:RNA polymerase sigma-70 factor (ECF subfamily)
MVAPEMTLAVPREIMDNGDYAGVRKAWLAPGVMSQDTRKEPVWGTSDKARLADLVSRGRQGDLMAMESLYEMFKRPVLGLAYRHTMNSAAAEDLLQDIFLKVFSHLGDVRDADTFPAWVFRIALNTCYSYLRQKKAKGDQDISLSEIEETVVIESFQPAVRDLKEPLEKAIQSLPPRLKSVFVLHDVEGYKHEEISRLLGCTVGTSKSQLFKARMKLRAFLRARNIA